MKRSHQPRAGQVLFAGIFVGLILTLVVTQAPLATEVDRKLAREIRISEEFISDMLVESPNWLVSWGGPNHGTYLDGYGVIFHFEASLVSNQHINIGRKGIFGLKNLGKDIFIWSDDDEDDEELEELLEDDEEAYQKYKEKKKQRAERMYERGKEELKEVLIDAGDVMNSLAANEWVTLVVILDDNKFFRKNKLDRFVLKAKASDLKAHASGQISEEQLFDRMAEEEY